MSKIAKITRLLARATRKCVTRPDEAWLLLRMAWWVAVLSATARYYSLPRALEIVAGNQHGCSRAAANQEGLAHAIDLLLSADVLIFKPVCWKIRTFCIAIFHVVGQQHESFSACGTRAAANSTATPGSKPTASPFSKPLHQITL